MKFGQILVCCMANISNMFLAECWRLETSSRLFYDFIKMTIQQDLIIFNGYSKIHLVSCTNTHHDVTDLVNHGMVKNTKT